MPRAGLAGAGLVEGGVWQGAGPLGWAGSMGAGARRARGVAMRRGAPGATGAAAGRWAAARRGDAMVAGRRVGDGGWMAKNGARSAGSIPRMRARRSMRLARNAAKASAVAAGDGLGSDGHAGWFMDVFLLRGSFRRNRKFC